MLLDLEDLDESTIPDYDQLTPAQQVMKSEEGALRERLRETAKIILSDEFDDMEDVDAYLLLRQFVGMTLYHSSLITRMEDIIQFKS